MSIKELDRINVIKRVCEKQIKVSKAAKILNISEKQIKRLKKRFIEEGIEGLVSKKVGAPSNNRISQEKKDLVLRFLNQEDHKDFGPFLVHEYLTKEHAKFISITSVRHIMIEYGLWAVRKCKSKKIYRLRQRRSQRGELIQVDGSEHDWFEGRGPRCTLLVYIDDATNETFAKFVKSENTWDYLHTTREYIEKNGRPCAFYSDKHSVFRVNQEGALKGNGKTQYGRAMEELGITLICANSPQAKGRVERKNRDFQNRLVKAMRLAKISTIDAGNAFLPVFLQELGFKFDKVPQNPIDAHRPLLETHDLDKIFCLKHTRKISKNLILQFNGVLYQMYADKLEYTLRNQEITVLEYSDGRVLFERKGKLLKAIPYKEVSSPAEEVSAKELLSALLEKEVSKPKKKNWKPGAGHPWKQGAKRRSRKVVNI